MRAFNSLSRALRLSAVSQMWGRTGLKTRVMNNLLATFCLHFTRTFFRRPFPHADEVPLTCTESDRGSIVLDGPSALRSPEAIQMLQATPTCLVTCHVTQRKL